MKLRGEKIKISLVNVRDTSEPAHYSENWKTKG